MSTGCKKCGEVKLHRGRLCLGCYREAMRDAQRSRRSDPAVRRRDSDLALKYRTVNLECYRLRDSLKYEKRLAWVYGQKSKPCADCSKTFLPCAMDFDHVRGVKFKGIGEMLTYSLERLQEEISKCDLVCSNCHRLRTELRRVNSFKNRSREKFYVRVDSLKNLPCLDCGSRFPPEAMDFDHVAGEKIMSIAQMRSRAWVGVVSELNKCELVCSNCHRVRTWQRGKAA